MMIKVSSSLTKATKNRYQLIIGTHNGIFHIDELLACAILCLIFSNLSILILRARKEDLLAQCDICVDVGGGKYDHHQLGFNKARTNGIKYASAGLVWNDYGKQLIDVILKKYFPNIKCDTDFIFNIFDKTFIIPADLEDNGKQKEKHCFSFISSFLPLYFNNRPDDFNNQFYKALIATIEVLEQKLLETISIYLSSNDLKTKLSSKTKFYILFQNFKSKIGRKLSKIVILVRYNSSYFNNGILEIPSQTVCWKETIVNINYSTKPEKINFVIFPYLDGGWAAQCVPPTLKDEFDQRIAFPLEWAGQTDNLPTISGIKGAIRCNGRFFLRAKDKQSIIEMCIIATNKAKF